MLLKVPSKHKTLDVTNLKSNRNKDVSEKDYFSRDRGKSKECSKIYVENMQDYHTERHNYKSVQREKRKKNKKRLSSRKRHESSKRRLANKRDISLKDKSGGMYTNESQKNCHVISPQLREELESINSNASKNTGYNRHDEKIYSNRYQSESERVYQNDESLGLASPIQKLGQHSNRNKSKKNENPLKISWIPSKGTNSSIPNEGTHSSQIYTFREQNKNEEYFKSYRFDGNNNIDSNDSDFITGYFSPDEHACTSTDKRKEQEVSYERMSKKILVQKNLNLKDSFQKGKMIKVKNEPSISPKNGKSMKIIGKENKNVNTGEMWTTLNVNDSSYNVKNSLVHCEDDKMRRSNPVGWFYKESVNKSSFKTSNSKTTQNDNTISESSNTHLSKSDINFHKSTNSKKRLRSRRKNSKTKLDCKSTREGEERSQNFAIYGSILQNTRNKRKSLSRPEEKESASHYKDKYNRMKRMYEYEKSSKIAEIEQLTNENEVLKNKVEIMKQDHFNEVLKLKQQMEEALEKSQIQIPNSECCLSYFFELENYNLSAIQKLGEIPKCFNCWKSRSQSMMDDRSNADSKIGESTTGSDKLTRMLKNKETNILNLMQELKGFNQANLPTEENTTGDKSESESARHCTTWACRNSEMK
jgi:hypothetical protein